MKVHKVLFFLLLIAVFVSFNLIEALALSPMRLDENAVKLCKLTGGKVIEEFHGRIEELRGWPDISVECVCPNGERQSLYVSSKLETWKGCQGIGRVPIISKALELAPTKLIFFVPWIAQTLVGSVLTSILCFSLLIFAFVLLVLGVKRRSKKLLIISGFLFLGFAIFIYSLKQ